MADIVVFVFVLLCDTVTCECVIYYMALSGWLYKYCQVQTSVECREPRKQYICIHNSKNT